MKPHFCEIEGALGRSEPCPHELCPFWQDGGCVVAGARPDLKGTAGLPELLLHLRDQLGDARSALDSALLPGEYR
jgi:hypothetical protein